MTHLLSSVPLLYHTYGQQRNHDENLYYAILLYFARFILAVLSFYHKNFGGVLALVRGLPLRKLVQFVAAFTFQPDMFWLKAEAERNI